MLLQCSQHCSHLGNDCPIIIVKEEVDTDYTSRVLAPSSPLPIRGFVLFNARYVRLYYAMFVYYIYTMYNILYLYNVGYSIVIEFCNV
jgi:hypothetical protein